MLKTAMLALVSVIVLSTVHLTRLRPAMSTSSGEFQAIPGEVRRILAFGYRVSASDLAWLDAIQYYGNSANGAEHFDELGPILNLVTDLDPHFAYAYQFAGEAVPYHEPQGEKRWYNTKRAIELLRKGMNNSPSRWEIPWLLGYDLYTYWGKYQEAGEVMLQASALADRGQRSDERYAPPTYLRSLALRLLAQGGSLETAIDTTRLAVARATDDQARAEDEARLNALLLDQQLQQLNALASTRAEAGQHPRSVADLVAGSNLDGLTEDPYGDAFYFDASGQVKSRNQDKLLRLRIHPGQPAIEYAVD